MPDQSVPYVLDLHPTKLYDYPLTVRPSPLDVRDFSERAVAGAALPSGFVLPLCAAPRDQLPLGACTSNGMSGMYETELLIAGYAPVQISRLALYYAERVIEDDVGQDNGAVPRDGLLTMQRSGVGAESLWPYDISKFTLAPPAAEIADAPNHKIAAFYRVAGLTDAKATLYAGHPVGIGMLVFNGMEQSRNGVIPMPDATEQPLGGHFVYLRGWQDDDTWPGGGYFILRNSWGAAAGDGHGDYMLPYRYAGNSQMVSEYWSIELPPAPTPPAPAPNPWPVVHRRRHWWSFLHI